MSSRWERRRQQAAAAAAAGAGLRPFTRNDRRPSRDIQAVPTDHKLGEEGGRSL